MKIKRSFFIISDLLGILGYFWVFYYLGEIGVFLGILSLLLGYFSTMVNLCAVDLTKAFDTVDHYIYYLLSCSIRKCRFI